MGKTSSRGMCIRSTSDMNELYAISNSPPRRKGNLNYQKKQGVASFNQKARRKEHEPDCYAT